MVLFRPRRQSLFPELEEESELYDYEIPAPAELPGQDPEEELRAALSEEEPRRYASRPFTEQEGLPLTAGLGVQEEEAPEGLGAFTETSPEYQRILRGEAQSPESEITTYKGKEFWFPPGPRPGQVSDEQARQWAEEVKIDSAPDKIRLELRKSDDYRQELIDKQFEGVDPNVRDVKKHASSEMSEAKKQFEEILGRTPNTPQERLASFNFQQKAKEEAYKQKQDDIAALNNAVSKYNTEQVIPRVKFIQGEADMLQEKHAAQEQAEIEALGKVEAERAKGVGEKQPSPVTWTTATKQVSRRFGKEDPMGNIIVTPELAGMNRMAQKKLVELKKRGNIEPLDAVNQAEEFARNVERKYWEYVDAAKGNKEARDKINKAFKSRYKYVPRIRQR